MSHAAMSTKIVKPTRVKHNPMAREFFFNCPYCDRQDAVEMDRIGGEFVCHGASCRKDLRLMLTPKEWDLVGTILHWKCVGCKSQQTALAADEYVDIPCKACGLKHCMPYSFDKALAQRGEQMRHALIKMTASPTTGGGGRQTIRCPYCAQMIDTAARVCPHCRSSL